MAKKLRIIMAQLNLTVGDIEGNLKKSIDAAIKARDEFAADMIVFPELTLTGYPPEDLLLRKGFLDAAATALNQFKDQVQNIYCVISHPHHTTQGLFNSCSLIYNGTILGRYAKQYLPNYGVFDEARYFIPGNAPCVIPVNGIPVGLVICEDLWNATPTQQAANLGARIIVSPNASPFEIDKHEQRLQVLSKRAKSSNVPIVYVNNIGGQDELVFDGGSMAIDQEGKLCRFAGFFQEILMPVDIEVGSTETKIAPDEITLPTQDEIIYQTLVQGTRDYIHKNGFKGVLVGVSGGIDSALVLTIAVDALGKDNVKAILLPSRYTADISIEYGLALTKNLGVQHEIISIEPSFTAFQESLKEIFQGKNNLAITEQNMQARCRGLIMMALSNQSGWLVLTTGNRSEMACGYATLYGDMAGGFAVLKDVPKTLVYRLSHYRNQISAVIPQEIIDRAPTAELAPNQKDEDTLPPYPILDKILELYLNQDQTPEEIVAQGFDQDTVSKVIMLIKKNEYKRRQAPIGIRINHKNFGRDWRYPVTAK